MKTKTTDGMKYEASPLKSTPVKSKQVTGVKVKLDKELDFNKNAIKQLKIEIKSRKRSIKNHKLLIKAAKLQFKAARV